MGRATNKHFAVASSASTLRGTLSPQGSLALPLGVYLEDYPRAFAPGQHFFARAIVDFGAESLPAWDIMSKRDEVKDKLLKELGDAKVKNTDVIFEFAPDGPLHALVIEHVPEWARKHNMQHKNVNSHYREHLGIGIYVYDCDSELWYKRVLHGRSIATAARFPLGTLKGAHKKLVDLRIMIANNRFSARTNVTEGYSKRMLALDLSLREPERARAELEEREAARQIRRADKARERREREKILAQQRQEQEDEIRIEREREERQRRMLIGISPYDLLKVRNYKTHPLPPLPLETSA